VIEERLTIPLCVIECKEDFETLLMNSEDSILILIFSTPDSIGHIYLTTYEGIRPHIHITEHRLKYSRV